MKTFTLIIQTSNNQSLYESITKLLKVEPKPFEPFFLDDIQNFSYWEYKLDEDPAKGPQNSLDRLLDLLGPHYANLSNLDIAKSDISISMHHEFGIIDEEFDSDDESEFNNDGHFMLNSNTLKKLSESGLDLNVSYYDVNLYLM